MVEISERFLLKNRLGSQHKRKFGEIFLAIDKQSGEKVVLKAVRSASNDPVSADRLRAEAGFSFDFKGLPKTILHETSDSAHYLIRRYAEGIPLDQYWKSLKRRQHLPFLIELLKQLVPIFDHLNLSGIVHCDIKPSNILVQPTSDAFEIHLLDFGLAIRTENTEENAMRKLLFPLGYAAPELLLNHLDLVEHRTDLFALAIVIWRLYAGKLPLTHPNPSVFTNLQLTHPLPEHSEISSKIHAILAKMAVKHAFKLPPNRMTAPKVRTALKDAIEARYNSLQEVINDLEQIGKRRRWF